ncbi:hypothetical protein ACHAW6_012034 [Cyclotella cf. meneghiniana]
MSFKLEVSNHILRTHKISGTIVQTWKQNTGIRFAISGVLGNLIFFSLDKLLLPIIVKCADSGKSATVSAASKWISRNAESVSFFVAYLLDIIVQHFFNALLVFGVETIKTRDMYLSSLATSYTAYLGTLCGSTILQAYLLHQGVPKPVAFWGTISVGSLVNFALLMSLEAHSKSSV